MNIRTTKRACRASAQEFMSGLVLAAAVLLLWCAPMIDGCPYMKAKQQEQQVPDGKPSSPATTTQHRQKLQLPAGHPHIPQLSRKLLQSSEAPTFVPSPEYLAAFKALMTNFEQVLGNCQFSLEGMAYNNNTVISVNSPNVFMPAASWLRAFFHDAGTFIKSTNKGGPNGSLGVGCSNSTCAKLDIATPAAVGAICLNGAPSVGGFTDGLNYCCPQPTQCVVQAQSASSGSPGPGLVVPGCLDGSADTVELCRRENDGLVSTIQFFRNRQNNPIFQYNTSTGLQKLSLADIIVGGAVTVAKQCSGGALVIPQTVGRPEAVVADEGLLPSPASILDDGKHFSAFSRMGLSKVEMVTLVVGSHSIGGLRSSSSPDLAATCPFVPFDCTPAKQISGASWPFDNSVFKVACNGVRGVTTGDCAWTQRCTNPAIAETDCPIEQRVRERFTACGGYPQPGLSSDIFLCSHDATVRNTMVRYARDESYFFKQYAKMFDDLAAMSFKPQDLTAVA
jgi:hypothetical protein